MTDGPVRIGVISDTHVPVYAPRVPEKLLRGLEGVDLILHAGDIVELGVLDELRQIADTQAVCGNMDPADVRAHLPGRRVVAVAGRRIGLVHGSGPPFGLTGRVAEVFCREGVDMIVFGHSHRPWAGQAEGVAMFNPGSPTDTRFTDVRSYGILTVDETLESEIIYLN